jgi:ribosomal protein S18 acetylase RimI-like enzyme
VLVASIEGDARPVAIARLVRDGNRAEIAFAVADDHQQRGIGPALAMELIADARAAGITEIEALVSSDNRAAISLLRRIAGALDIHYEGPELSIHASIA